MQIDSSHQKREQLKKWLNLEWDAIAVHFGEIALKGGNRKQFVERLRSNLRSALQGETIKIRPYHDHLTIEAPSALIPSLLDRAARVFGVNYVVPIRRLDRSIDAMKEEAAATWKAVAKPGDTLAVRVRRSDKSFPKKSAEVAREVGGATKDIDKATVNLSNPDVEISFRIREDNVLQTGPRFKGPDGLPVGSSERTLALFSGGIDSPAAVWLMNRRGSRCDFLHYHTYPSAEAVKDTKIYGLIEQLVKPQGLSAKLHLVPYTTFEGGMFGADIPQQLELVIFRRFMARVASTFARHKHYGGIVTGDNLGQVASQTMENLIAFDDAAVSPVFRPLLTFNKEEIINLTRQIGTFEPSLADYKDCCSIVAKHPHTCPKLYRVQEHEARLDVEQMTQDAIDSIETFVIS